MLALRTSFKFCRTQAYLQRFKVLEEQVNRREKELIDKKEQLKRLQQLSKLTPAEKVYQSLSVILNNPFQSEAVRKEKERLKSMFDDLEKLKNQQTGRTRISTRLAQQQKLKRQKIFLTDLARFANKFHQVAHEAKLKEEVKLGLQLSCKNLQSKLQREGVEFIGAKDEPFNKQIHDKVDGEGLTVKQVVQRGIRTRGQLISKAKVQCRG